jgi:hypothetical protein
VVDVRNDREIPDEFAIHVVGDWPESKLSHTGASGRFVRQQGRGRLCCLRIM